MNIYKQIMNTATNELNYYNALKESALVDGKIISLGQLLERSYRLFPNNTAVIWQDAHISYKELYYRSILFSKKLQEQGVKPRERVILFFENSLNYYIAYFGIVQTGAVVTPLNTFLHESELQHIVTDAKPTAIVADSTYLELFRKINHQAQILTEQDLDMHSSVPTEKVEHNNYRLEFEEMAALLYTSGTTGVPKGVMLSSKNIISNVMQGMARLELKEKEILFGILPLFHSFSQNTCVWATLFSGCSVIVIPKIERRYILEGFKHKPTIVLGVPALFGLFCLMKTIPVDSVKYFVSGGDALPDKIRSAFAMIYNRKLVNGYGLTEASPMVSVDLEDVTEPTSCIGKPLVTIEAAIIDENNNKVASEHIGELIIKGDNIMLGYYNAPEITAKTIKDGWLYTGDLAYIDENGKIVITGRSKDLIIHKGQNIYPQEIENIILLHPLVMRVGVVGKPDQATGEVPVAFVQLRTTQEGIEAELKQLCTKHLANYKIPKDFFVTTENLPTTTTGKVDKKILRKRL